MKVFISWSGGLSKAVALAVHAWLPFVFQDLEVFMSHEDIDSGSRWFEIIGTNLDDSDFGIVVTTRDNQQRPWLLFEAGAISNALAKSGNKARVVPLLVDFDDDKELLAPLSLYQGRMLTEDGVRRLVEDINTLREPSIVQPSKLPKTFERFWPDLHADVAPIVAEWAKKTHEAPPKPRPDSEVLSEVLSVVRNLGRDVQWLTAFTNIIATRFKGIEIDSGGYRLDASGVSSVVSGPSLGPAVTGDSALGYRGISGVQGKVL